MKVKLKTQKQTVLVGINSENLMNIHTLVTLLMDKKAGMENLNLMLMFITNGLKTNIIILEKKNIKNSKQQRKKIRLFL